MVIIENSNISREEQIKIKRLVNNSLHNSYKMLKNQIGEFADYKEEYFSRVAELEEQERKRKY